MKLQNEVSYIARISCSSKYPDATKHPKLVVIYKANQSREGAGRLNS